MGEVAVTMFSKQTCQETKRSMKADGDGNIHTLSPANAGALPEGEPLVYASRKSVNFPDKHRFCGHKSKTYTN